MVAIPQCSNPALSRVAGTQVWLDTMPAIIASDCEIGRPMRVRSRTIHEYANAAEVSKGNTRAESRSGNSLVAALANCCFRQPVEAESPNRRHYLPQLRANRFVDLAPSGEPAGGAYGQNCPRLILHASPVPLRLLPEPVHGTLG